MCCDLRLSSQHQVPRAAETSRLRLTDHTDFRHDRPPSLRGKRKAHSATPTPSQAELALARHLDRLFVCLALFHHRANTHSLGLLLVFLVLETLICPFSFSSVSCLSTSYGLRIRKCGTRIRGWSVSSDAWVDAQTNPLDRQSGLKQNYSLSLSLPFCISSRMGLNLQQIFLFSLFLQSHRLL